MPRTTLIVVAHPEPQSVSGAWARASAQAAGDLGDKVLWSDLYAIGFDPAEGPGHYPTGGGRFDALKAQEAASRAGALPADVADEVAKIAAADRILFHFPIWWFGPPAMLKGWADRCLAHGALHDVDHRFDTGRCRGTRALFCVTTGASAAEAGPGGKEGETRLLLWPLAHALRYCGVEVAEPACAHGVHGYHTVPAKAALDARVADLLAGQATLLAGFEERPTIRFNAATDFDADGRLRPGAPSLSPFIRHRDEG